MTIQKTPFNLGQMWEAVLEAPNVKENPKNVKVGNIIHAALQQQKIEDATHFSEEKIVLTNVARQLSVGKKKDVRLASFAERLVNMAQFQRYVGIKDRLALRNASDALAGKRFLLMRAIRNALYEFGVSVKRSWERPFIFEAKEVYWKYNVKLESGLRKLLASKQPLTKMSKNKLKQKLEEWFPPLHRHAAMGYISQKTRNQVDGKMSHLRHRLYDIITKTTDKEQIPKKIEKLGQEIEHKK
jgi:hypothetical protein